MKTLLFYLLQMVISSGLLYGYYHLFLRNKKFHQYNRYYLLATILISILIPFLDIPIYFSRQDEQAVWMQTISDISAQPVMAGNYYENSSFFTGQNIAMTLYLLAAAFILIRFLLAIKRIRTLLRKYKVEKLDDIYFINTEEQGTPFSFFRWMFWNKKITLQSEDGQQIFRHELFHIKQKHSLDIVFAELATIVFWVNPFFHLIKKELQAIHEFLADQFAIKENDQWNYAELLLMQLMGTPNLRLTHPFFHNQIKRRIAMITSSKKPKYRYFRKILVLPLLVLIAAVFAFSYKQKQEDNTLQEQRILPADDNLTGEIMFADSLPKTLKPSDKEKTPTPDLYIIGGKKYTRADIEKLFGSEIELDAGIVYIEAGNAEAIKKYGPEARNGVIEFKNAEIKKRNGVEEIILWKVVGQPLKTPLYIIDGEVQPKSEGNDVLKKLSPEFIQQLNVLKGKIATDKYGEQGAEGVIEVVTKLKLVAGGTVKEKQAADEIVEEKQIVDKVVKVHEVLKEKQKEDEVVEVVGYLKEKQTSDQQPEEIVINDASPIVEKVVKSPVPVLVKEIDIEKLSPLYPNPAGNSVTIPLNTQVAGNGEVIIHDSHGRVYQRVKASLVKGSNTVNLNVSTLAVGVYIVSVVDANKGTAGVYKLVKK